LKNRKLLYILIPATVFIWGAIAYTVVKQLHYSDQGLEENYLPFTSTKADTVTNEYELQANYRDPFRTGNFQSESSKRSRNTSGNVNNRNTTIQQRFIYWPGIEYMGVIMNNKKQVALLCIEGANLLMQEGEERKQVKVLKIYSDSVQLSFQGQNKVFRKNKN
jgi:hypothetical protein